MRAQSGSFVVVTATIGVAGAVLLGACGPGTPATPAASFTVQVSGDSSVPRAGTVATDVPVTVVADADRTFPRAKPTAPFDIELLGLGVGEGRAHLVIRSDAIRAPVVPPDGAALTFSAELPCCDGPRHTSAVLSDGDGVIAIGEDSSKLGTIDDTDVKALNAGTRDLAAPNSCGSSTAIAVQFASADHDAITLATGESGKMRAAGGLLVITNAASASYQSHCTDSLSGDIASWVAAREAD